MTSLEMENSMFTSWLDGLLFILWNYAIHPMNFWVCTAGTYRATAILGRVHAAFFNYNHFNEMTNMPDKIILARIMTALDLELRRALHYHEEGYENDNNYGIPGQVMRPMNVYWVSTTEASFNSTDYRGAQCPISPFTQRWSRDELPFHQEVCRCLTFEETPPSEVDSGNKEDFPTADLDDPVWSEKPIPNNCQQLCIHLILHSTTRPATPTPQPVQEEVPPEPEQMDMEILDYLPDVINVPKELLSDSCNMPFKSGQWISLTDINGHYVYDNSLFLLLIIIITV